MSILCINDKAWKYEVLQAVHNILLLEFQDISSIFQKTLKFQDKAINSAAECNT